MSNVNIRTHLYNVLAPQAAGCGCWMRVLLNWVNTEWCALDSHPSASDPQLV